MTDSDPGPHRRCSVRTFLCSKFDVLIRAFAGWVSLRDVLVDRVCSVLCSCPALGVRSAFSRLGLCPEKTLKKAWHKAAGLAWGLHAVRYRLLKGVRAEIWPLVSAVEKAGRVVVWQHGELSNMPACGIDVVIENGWNALKALCNLGPHNVPKCAGWMLGPNPRGNWKTCDSHSLWLV